MCHLFLLANKNTIQYNAIQRRTFLGCNFASNLCKPTIVSENRPVKQNLKTGFQKNYFFSPAKLDPLRANSTAQKLQKVMLLSVHHQILGTASCESLLLLLLLACVKFAQRSRSHGLQGLQRSGDSGSVLRAAGRSSNNQQRTLVDSCSLLPFTRHYMEAAFPDTVHRRHRGETY